MKSDARRRLHKKLSDVEVGQSFQLVNTVMGAAMPKAIVFTKALTSVHGTNAIRKDTNKYVTLREDSLVEIV